MLEQVTENISQPFFYYYFKTGIQKKVTIEFPAGNLIFLHCLDMVK